MAGIGIERAVGKRIGLYGDVQLAATGGLVPWLPFVEIAMQSHIGIDVRLRRR